MKDRLVYVELKSGHSDNGPAWIGMAGSSKTGATIYSNGKAFKSLKGSGIGANFFDIETGDEYWISGIKKNNQDRHRAGSGKVAIDRAVVSNYLAETGLLSLPTNLIPTDLLPAKQQSRHREIEHSTLADSLESREGAVPDSRAESIKHKV